MDRENDSIEMAEDNGGFDALKSLLEARDQNAVEIAKYEIREELAGEQAQVHEDISKIDPSSVSHNDPEFAFLQGEKRGLEEQMNAILPYEHGEAKEKHDANLMPTVVGLEIEVLSTKEEMKASNDYPGKVKVRVYLPSTPGSALDRVHEFVVEDGWQGDQLKQFFPDTEIDYGIGPSRKIDYILHMPYDTNKILTRAVMHGLRAMVDKAGKTNVRLPENFDSTIELPKVPEYVAPAVKDMAPVLPAYVEIGEMTEGHRTIVIREDSTVYTLKVPVNHPKIAKAMKHLLIADSFQVGLLFNPQAWEGMEMDWKPQTTHVQFERNADGSYQLPTFVKEYLQSTSTVAPDTEA